MNTQEQPAASSSTDMNRLCAWLMLAAFLVGLGSCVGYGQLGGFTNNDHGQPDLKSTFAGLFMLSVLVAVAAFVMAVALSVVAALKKLTQKR
jgi:hypothetical protein